MLSYCGVGDVAVVLPSDLRKTFLNAIAASLVILKPTFARETRRHVAILRHDNQVGPIGQHLSKTTLPVVVDVADDLIRRRIGTNGRRQGA